MVPIAIVAIALVLGVAAAFSASRYPCHQTKIQAYVGCFIIAALASLGGTMQFALDSSRAVAAEASFPQHAIRIVVPVPPGGFADTLPRLIAQELSARWGQPVVVVNHPGATLNLGAEDVAKAPANGYTLLATPAGPIATNRFLFAHLPYDPDAFVPVTVLAKGPFLLVARRGLPVSSLSELVAYAKANPGKLTFASSGKGSPPHLAMEMIAHRAGIEMLHVPFKGLAPALNAVVGGQVDLMLHDFPSAFPQIKAHNVKPLGVTSEQRLERLPEVPAIAETLPGFESGFWYAVVAPPKTPAPIASAISRAIAEALRSPDIASRLRDYAITPVGSSPAETEAFFKSEIGRWRDAVAAAAIKAQ